MWSFDVPDVISFDDSAGVIVFRFVPDTVSLRTYFAIETCECLASRCGQALAHIHLAGAIDKGRVVSWHGDYGLANVLYSEDSDRLTIIDWSNAHWTGISPCQSAGSAGVDLGIAIFSLFHRMIMRRPHVQFPERIGSAFLAGYRLVRPGFRLASESDTLADVHYRWRRYYFARFGRLKTVAMIPSWIRVLRFLASATQRF